MPVTLKKQRDGSLRPCWYGVYTDGKRRVVNLNVPIRGNPPASLSLKDQGDHAFERSREKAEEALSEFVEDAGHKGRAEHLVERLIESKTGGKIEYIKLADMLDKWLESNEYSTGYKAECRAIFNRFVDFMHKRNARAVYAYQVRVSDVKAFRDFLRPTVSPRTFEAHIGILRPAFDLCLPAGSFNPFRSGKKGRHKPKSERGEESVHRIPFTPQELDRVFQTARELDPSLYGPIVAAACTGLRRGDVCTLTWDSINFPEGMIATKTAKTGEPVSIPIFQELRPVLENRQGNGSKYVFPEAELILNGRINPDYPKKSDVKYLIKPTPDGLSWRFKKIIAQAFTTTPALPPPVSNAAEVKTAGLAAIDAMPEGKRRDRVRDAFTRYCAGESVRTIAKPTSATGKDRRGQVSADLHHVELLIGKPFMRNWQRPDMKTDIARLTRAPREHGQRAASVRDWHALRTTFVTWALSHGVSLELVRRVTGHKADKIALENYYMPGKEDYKAAFLNAMPAVLTGNKTAKKSPADELAALARKVAAGSATVEDKARLRKLAMKV
jgi:integrase